MTDQTRARLKAAGGMALDVIIWALAVFVAFVAALLGLARKS